MGHFQRNKDNNYSESKLINVFKFMWIHDT